MTMLAAEVNKATADFAKVAQQLDAYEAQDESDDEVPLGAYVLKSKLGSTTAALHAEARVIIGQSVQCER